MLYRVNLAWAVFELCSGVSSFHNCGKFWIIIRITFVVYKKGIFKILRRVWRYQRGNQNPYIEEQTTQWPKEKVRKDKQRSTKHTYKTKDRVTWTPLKTGGELSCSGRVGSSCSTSGTRSVNLVTNPVISREWWKDIPVLYNPIVFTIVRAISYS